MDLVSFDPRDPATSRSRRLGLAAAQAYHDQYGHLAVPATTPLGAWLAEQRHLAAAGQLTPARTDALNAIDPNWRLPHGADWHRKRHLLRTHLQAGNDPATLAPDTRIAGVNITSWLTRFTALHPGQRDLTSLDLTPTTNPWHPRAVLAAPSRRPCSSWSSSSTATAAPPPPEKPSASTATPSRSAPGSPKPAPSTATATSPPTTQPSSTETGAPPMVDARGPGRAQPGRMTPEWNRLEDAQLALGSTTAAGVLGVVAVGFALRLLFTKRPTRWACACAICETALFLGLVATAASIPLLSLWYAWDRDLWVTLAANAAVPPVVFWWVRDRYGWPGRRKQ
ncbi:helicase associated domain-containing protein [Streptomyces sp. CB02613]|uniref:helicase associated domain-containing protein n=1 Tax=Streptomyces sp. CB02613 TaxID=2020328 RepID=UPI001F270FBE|nr:helicase associated domain-containing protein [Streptomyces sp. CB02613]